jgi:hypothetical protein
MTPKTISKQAAPLRIFHALLQAHRPANRMGYACWRHAVFALLRLGLVELLVVVGRLPTGGSPISANQNRKSPVNFVFESKYKEL